MEFVVVNRLACKKILVEHICISIWGLTAIIKNTHRVVYTCKCDWGSSTAISESFAHLLPGEI